MIARIPLTGNQLATMNLRPDICRKSGAQIMKKELVGGESQLSVVKKELQAWLKSSPEVTLEIEIAPIIEQIDSTFS